MGTNFGLVAETNMDVFTNRCTEMRSFKSYT